MSKRYAVVVTGELKPGASRDQVRQVFLQHYKLPESQVETLLSGKRVVVKRGVEREAGSELAKRFQAAGMVCGLAEVPAPDQANEPRPLPPEEQTPSQNDPLDGDWPPRQSSAPPASWDDDDDDWPPKPPQTSPPPRAVATDPAEVVPQVLSLYGENKGAYPFENIPPKILNNALQSCFMSSEDTVYGVVDLSSGGSGKQCMLFGQDGVTYCMGKKKRGFLSYDEFMTASMTAPNKDTIILNHEHQISMFLTPMKLDEGMLFIKAVQDALKDGLEAKGPGQDMRRIRNRPNDLEKAVAFIMEPYLSMQRTHVIPDIPPKREQEARKAGYVPKGENCLGIICLKVLGKYDKYLLVTDKGLHYRQNMSMRGFIPYADLPSQEFSRAGISLLNLGDRGELDISGGNFKWWELCAILGALQDIALEHVLNREPFKEPEESRLQCPRCGSANLGLSTKFKPSYAWGFVGYLVSAPISQGGSAVAAKYMSDTFGKTVYYMACRHCGNGWVDRTNAAAGDKGE